MRLKIFWDTNIVIDFLAERNPFYFSVSKILSIVEANSSKLYVSSLSIVNTEYVLKKLIKKEDIRLALQKFSKLINITKIDSKIISLALLSDFKDFEDAVQYYSAKEAGCNLIITRNTQDFEFSDIQVLTPMEFIDLLCT